MAEKEEKNQTKYLGVDDDEGDYGDGDDDDYHDDD